MHSIKMVMFVLLHLVIFSESFLQVPQSEVSSAMKVFLTTSRFTYEDRHSEIGVLGDLEGYPGDLLDYFLNLKDLDVIIRCFEACSKTILVFLQDVEDLEDFVNITRGRCPFNSLDFVYFFVFGEDTSWIASKLEWLWNSKLLNYVIVYEVHQKVYAISYNPFKKSLLNFTQSFDVNSFPKLLHNLHRYIWRVGIGEMVLKRNEVLKSNELATDKKRFQEIALALNATFELVVLKTTLEVKRAIFEGTIDFPLQRSFQIMRGDGSTAPSYPVAFEYLVLMVPQSKPLAGYKLVTLTLETPVWASLTVFLLLLPVLLHILKIACPNSTLTIFQVFLNISSPEFHKSSSQLSMVLLTWSVYSMLMSWAFNATLRDSLITTKYEKGIETQHDLKRSDLKVYFNYKKYKSVIGEFKYFEDHFINLYPNFKITMNAIQGNDDFGYVIYGELAKEIVNLHKLKVGRRLFKVLPNRFVGSFRVFSFPGGSVFVDKINEMLLVFDQHGLSKFGFEKQEGDSKRDLSRARISLRHLESSFFVLLLGFGCSTLVFLGETYWFRAIIWRLLSFLKRSIMVVTHKT